MTGKKGKIRTKLGASKGKRWKKGHSSSSNPEGRKHRLQAKNRFFHQNIENSSLTAANLAKHDDGDDMDTQSGPLSVSGVSLSQSASTFKTWASSWTDCTNTTFSKVHRYWASNSALHKEVLAVLAAVTEVIKENDGKETETEYFAALMTTLESAEEEQSKAATAYLLSLAIKKVPPPVLKKSFPEVSQALFDQLATASNSESTSLMKSLISCLSSLLRAQERSVWSDSSTMQLYNGILSFTAHSKPKVRKAAQQAVASILRGSSFVLQVEPAPHHPAASATAKYCIQTIEDSGGTGETSAHILGLLKDILGVFPANSLKSTCEAILRVMTLSNVIVNAVAMQALHSMFSMHPKPNCLSAELNAQLITALYDYQPSSNDSQPLSAWLAVMEKAHINLFRLDEKLCVSHLPRLTNTCMKCLLSEKMEICQKASHTVMLMLRQCVQPAAPWLVPVVQAASKEMTSPVHRMFRAVEAGLSYQYHASWSLVIDVLAVFFEVLGKDCSALMRKCLVSLADLRNSPHFPHKPILDHAVGVAIQKMGPQKVLAAVPLGITGDEDNYDFPRSWLLPVLRDNIRDTQLSFFNSYFLPLAAKLRAKSVAFEKAGKIVECKTYDALQHQIWSLLPGFCTRPTDLIQDSIIVTNKNIQTISDIRNRFRFIGSFKGVAKILGTAITDRPDLKMDVLSSLRKLILHAIDEKEGSEEDKAELSKFAKNYLPILFNVFTTEPENLKDMSRMAALETTKVYFKITDPKLIATFFDKAHDKVNDLDVTPFKRHALLDLLIAMIPYTDEERLKKLFRFAVPLLESDDRTIQKKSYRILETICESTASLVISSLAEIQQVLTKSLSASVSSAKAPRLRCLIHIVRKVSTNQRDFVTAVLPEAILCTREVAVKARGAAYLLLNEMCNAVVRWSDGTDEDSICDFFSLVLAGLAGRPHMISSTLLALTSLVHNFKDKISSQLLDLLVENTCLLLTSKTREVVQAALGFLKMLVSSFQDVDLGKHLEFMVKSLVSMKQDNKHHFRFKTKDLFTRLIRKFGYETIHGMVPESLQRMLMNIRKTQERAKRKKKQDDEESDDEETNVKLKTQPESIDELLQDSDSELDEKPDKIKPTKSAKKKKTKDGAAWLKEGGDDDIVDFLDPTVSKKVVATQPSTSKQARKQGDNKEEDHGFKLSADGRLIITEMKDESADKPKKSNPIDDVDELMDAMTHYSKKNRKRKLSAGDNDEEVESMPKYKAGGTGIHRPLGKNKPDAGSEYRSKKAGGDVKKKGAPDPYAYVPLSFQSLNKRKRAKNKGQFANLVKGAKKGALQGKKAKARQNKK